MDLRSLQSTLAAIVASVALAPAGAAQELDERDLTAAFFAALATGDEARVAALLDARPELVSAVDENGAPPLATAVWSDASSAGAAEGDSRGHWVQVARLLLGRGADARYVAGGGRTLLHGVRTTAMAELLLEAGAVVDAADALGETPLFEAATSERIEVVESLLAHGAAIDHRDRGGWSAVERAAQWDRPRAVAHLAARGAAGGELLVAAQTGDAAPVDRALAGPARCPPTAKSTALVLAARAGRADVARALVRAGAGTETADAAGACPLDYAVLAGDVELARLLLDHGASATPDRGERPTGAHDPLRVAVTREDLRMTELLLSRGAAPDVGERVGLDGDRMPSVLEIAVAGRSLALAELLLEHGASPDGPAGARSDPLAAAARARRRDALDLLLARGADPARSAALGAAVEARDAGLIEHLLERGFELGRLDLDGMSALDVAVLQGDLSLVALLLDRGARAEPADVSDVGPLHTAAKSGNAAAVDLLLARGADIERLDGMGDSPLDVAAARGDAAMVERLLARGARTRPPDAPNGGTLARAALSGATAVVELLVARGADPSQRNAYGRALLDDVIESGDLAMARRLIALGAAAANPHGDMLLEAVSSGDVAAVRALALAEDDLSRGVADGGATLLHVAARAGHADVARALLEAGASVDAPDALGQTPLHGAAGASTVAALVGHGASVDRTDVTGLTPLMWMALGGRADTMRELVARGASIDVRDGAGDSALDLAARARAEPAVSYLCSQGAEASDLVLAMQAGDARRVASLLAGPTELPPSAKTTALFMAVHAGRTDLAALLLAARADLEGVDHRLRTPLHCAVDAGDGELVGLLLDHGASADAADDVFDTPLRLAARRERRDLIESMLAHGADLDRAVFDPRHGRNVTPLGEAIERGSADFVEYLLARGASATSGAASGRTYLDLAVDADQVEIARVLLAHGARPNAPDEHDRRPLDRAQAAGADAMAALLRAHGAYGAEMVRELFDAIRAGGSASASAAVARLLDSAPELLAVQQDGDTPLLAALDHGDLLTLGAITARKPDPNVADGGGRTPLYLAAPNRLAAALVLALGPDVNARNGPDRRTALMNAVQGDPGTAREVVDMLLRGGADLGAADRAGATVMHYAAQFGDAALVELLRSRGAAVDARASNGATPLWVAANAGNVETLEALVRAGADPNLRGGDDPTPPLLVALASGHSDVVAALIRAKADVNALGRGGYGALHLAANLGDAASATLLLGAGANVNLRTPRGLTPVDVAKDDATVRLLRSRGGAASSELR